MSATLENKLTFHIGDASSDHAFLTNSEGYDIAVLKPTATERKLPEGHTLTPEQWQSIINLIDAAPDMLQALREIQANPNDPRCHRKAMDAINKATT